MNIIKRTVTCKKKRYDLTVGKIYTILNREEGGVWIYNDNGVIIFVNNKYFEVV